MSAFRGILTGFGMAAIKDKEAKDNAKMEVVKSAGIDYHTNQLPEHRKRETNRAQAYKQLTSILGSEEAADYFDVNFFTGDGKDVERALKLLENKKIKPDAFKNYIPTSNYSDRYKTRQTDFESRFDVVRKNLDFQGSGIGPSTINGLLTKPEGDITTTIKGEPGSQMGPVITEGTPDREETINRTTSSLPISTFYGAKPDERGIETKFKQIPLAINEKYGYGENIKMANGEFKFQPIGTMAKTANAHIALAEIISSNDKTINQYGAADQAKNMLVNLTEMPFLSLEQTLGGKYQAGDGGKAAMMSGSGTINANEVQYNDQSVAEYLVDFVINQIPEDNQGNINKAIIDKFIENIPNNLMFSKDESMADRLARKVKEENFYNTYK
jgi:hypothetical protein